MPNSSLLREARGKSSAVITNSGVSLGLAGIYRLDAGMGVGAPQDLAVEQPGELDLRSVLGSPGYFIHTVGSHRALADDLIFNLG